MKMLSLRCPAIGLLGAALWLAVADSASAQTLTWGVGGAGGSGTWSTSVANWNNGTGTVSWTNGGTAIFGGTAGTVNIDSSVEASRVVFNTPGYTIQNFFLEGAAGGLTVEANAAATISSSVFGSITNGGNTPFIKTGGGTLTFTGSNPSFFGGVTVAAGELRYTGTSALNSFVPYTLADAPGVALTFAGSVNTLDSLSGGGTSGGAVRPNVTTGTVGLSIVGSGNASFAGTIQDNGGATIALSKIVTGTQTLTGANTYSGTTTVSGGTLVLSGADGSALNTAAVTVSGSGTLLLDNSSAASGNRLANNLPVTLNGGTFSLIGNATADSKALVGNLTFSRAATVSVTQPGTPSATLTFANVTRQSNGTISFTGGGNIAATGLTNLNGIVGGYATVGADWATVDANNRVFAYTAYTNNLNSPTGQDNVRLTLTAPDAAPLTQSQIHNSLNLVNAGSNTTVLDLGVQRFDITSGGLLTSGGPGQTIRNGTLTSSGGELIVTNLAALMVSSKVADNGRTLTVTKSGAGTLTLSGANTYTGATVINQGTVRVATDDNLGTGASVVLNGGALQAAGSFTSAKSLQGSGGAVDTAGFNVAFMGGANTVTITKTGAGILSLTGAYPSATVNAGVLRLTNQTSGTGSSVTVTAGRLETTGQLSRVTTFGQSAELSPGGIGQAAPLTLDTLSTLNSSVIDFDLGSSAQDSLTITGSLSLTGSTLLFRFSDLGGTRTGTAYTLLNLPTFGGGLVSPSSFAIDPASLAAGYRGTFNLGTNTLSITFSAVPEPGALVWLCLGATAVGLIAWQRSKPRIEQ